MKIRAHPVMAHERGVKVCVPPASPVVLGAWLACRRNLVVLTGAGCSTDSGIPDYRGPDGTWRSRQPMFFSDFVGSAESRKHYWARSYRGWPRFTAARPNSAHRRLAELDSLGRIRMLVTQNVDGLHEAAGSRSVVDLHGRLDRVICLGCGRTSNREAWQERLAGANREWDHEAQRLHPDGDAEIEREHTRSFVVPPCDACGGIVKPDVVFFGESVPRERVEAVSAALGEADGMLVVGSSLAVWSGYRFVRRSAEMGLPIAILNRGVTRADDLATLRVEENAGAALDEALRRIGGS